MNQLIITKTKDYLILKIPLKSVNKGTISVSARDKKAITEGLKAIKDKKVSRSFTDTKEATSFLRSL